MPYVKVTGYIDVPDEHVADGAEVVTRDGYEEIQTIYVGGLEDLTIERDDRGGKR
jgi:hypothetical protein